MSFPLQLAFNPPTNPLTAAVFSGIFAPDVTTTEIADDERAAMHVLANVLLNPEYQGRLFRDRLYYDCLNMVESLGISVPPELDHLRAILGWCRTGVDARSERLTVMGFRMPGATEIDDDMQATWQANNLDADAPLVHDDAMICGRSYVILGGGPDDEHPLIIPEAPENMLGSWDRSKRDLSAAFQTYFDIDPASETYLLQLATLYTRSATLQLVRGTKGWQVQDRDDHGMDFVPVEMFTHAPTVKNRFGQSVMSPAWRNTQDRACRTLVRGEVASEFWATMKIFILGAAESDFKSSNGDQASAWETFIGRLSAIKADEFGNLPTIQEVRGESPDGIISTFDQQAKIMAGHMGVSSDRLGIYSDGNPASADAIRMADFQLKTSSDRLTLGFGNSWENVQRKARIIQGKPMDDMARLETAWAFTGIPTPNADAVTITTQIAAGSIPATSPTVLAKMNWTPVEIARMEIDRKKEQGLAVITQALAGIKPQAPAPDGQPGGQQPTDGQQPQALAALESSRSTDNASAG